ncbi:MAG: hypothetical protein ABIJ00_11410 [Candidatus Eisenbacteria bacterium]
MKMVEWTCPRGRSSLVFLALLVVAVAVPVLADGLLDKYEPVERSFERSEIGDKTVYFHQRMIDDAIVEKDHILYQFDKETEQLLLRRSNWRDGLPEHLPPGLMAREDAEAMVEGEAVSAELYFISPESDVFPLETVPENPCWVVRSRDGGRMVVTIIDAVEARMLGYGVPPPYTAFSFTGPWECPYSGAWTSWSQNAETWFNTMGYVTDEIVWAALSEIRSHVKSDNTALFYELNHGGSTSFSNGCDGESFVSIGSWQVAMWITAFAKMPFTFLGSCEGMCDIGSASFSYAFRKGSMDSTTTVGYCHMDQSQCNTCWGYSIDWQTTLFNYMNQGYTVKAAFDEAGAAYPTCANNGCMVFAGDEDFAVVPVVERDPWAPVVTVGSPDGGEILEYGTDHLIEWVATDNARVTSITILLSTDGGATFPDTIASGEANDSTFLWPVPDVDSNTARIKVVAADGVPHEGWDVSDTDFTILGSISGIEPLVSRETPDELTLSVTGGNPVSSESRIEFGMPAAGHIRLALYDVSGRHVTDLVDDHVSQGYHVIQWNGRTGSGTKVGAGVYFMRLSSDEAVRKAKVVIAR